ncbi:MAG: hypothetical protein IPN65_03775 [Elusimicrobia bacterium]|nr:hypothetical protein [Elusimicrobiota bacterium]
MKAPRASRGGILLDLFLIAALCAGGIALWVSRARWAPSLKRAVPGATAPTVPGAPERDWGARAAATQGWVRAFLSDAGVGDADVLKAYNAERREGDSVWVESTLEIRARRGFSSGRFLARPIPPPTDARLERRPPTAGRWLLELGEGARIYQRLIFILS